MSVMATLRKKYASINRMIEAHRKEVHRLNSLIFELEEERARIALNAAGVKIGDPVKLTGTRFKGLEAMVVDATQRRVAGECLAIDFGIDEKPHILVEVPGTRARAFHVSSRHWEPISPDT